jgi:hypothetical protein
MHSGLPQSLPNPLSPPKGVIANTGYQQSRFIASLHNNPSGFAIASINPNKDGATAYSPISSGPPFIVPCHENQSIPVINNP